MSVNSGRSGKPTGTAMDLRSPPLHLCYEHPRCTSREHTGDSAEEGKHLCDTEPSKNTVEDTLHNNVVVHPGTR